MKFQDWTKAYGEEDEYEAMLLQRKKLLDSQPEDPVRLFLYGAALRKQEESLAYFKKATLKVQYPEIGL